MAGAFSSAFSSAFDGSSTPAAGQAPVATFSGLVPVVRRLRQYVALAGPIRVPTPVVVPTYVAGESPAFLFRRPPLVPPTGTRWTEPIPAVVVPARSWSGFFPDRIDRRTMAAARQQPWAAPPNLTDLITLVHGPAGSSGQIRRPPLLLYQPWAGRIFVFEPFADRIVESAAPAILPRRPWQTARLQTLALPSSSPTTIPPAHSWHGSYPDRLTRPVLLAALQRAPSALDPLPLPATPAPTFSWQAISPARIDRRVFTIGMRTAFAEPIDPIATPAALLTFWWELPQQPVRTRPQPPGLRLATPGLFGGGTLVGSVPGWEPTFPVWLPLAHSVAGWPSTAGGLFTSGVLGAGYRVILLTDRGVRWTAITDELVVRSAITGESVRWVRIEEEEVD